MAKKTVASFQAGKTDGRSYTKVIKMEKSPKTGAYIFNEQMVRNEDVILPASSSKLVEHHIALANYLRELFCYQRDSQGIMRLFYTRDPE